MPRIALGIEYDGTAYNGWQKQRSGTGVQELLERALAKEVPEWPLRRWDLAELTLAAVYFQPTLALARAQAERAGAAVRTAGALPNPTLSIAPEIASNAASGVSPWLASIHLDWPVETAGKRGHRIVRAEAVAAGARFDVWSEVWRLRRQLEAVVIEIGAAPRRLRAGPARNPGPKSSW